MKINFVERAQPKTSTAQADVLSAGHRIRATRRRLKFTLEQLAGTVGMDKGFLSRLERGEKSASIATIQNIAKALGISVASLLGETHDPADIRIVRVAQRQALDGKPLPGMHSFSALTLSEGGEPFSAYVVEVGDDTERAVGAHAGQEMIFVLAGSVYVSFGGEDELLESGDSVIFPGHLQHRLRKQGRRSAQVLIVVGGQ
jgi:transcriptional regulator with XRE-family HTH domain